MRRSLSFAAFAIGATLAGCLAGAAQAHSPYLLPSAFDVTDRKLVTVQGSFTESFFSPEVVMKSDAWAVVGPDGARKPLTATNLRELALVEVADRQPAPIASPPASAPAAPPRPCWSRASGSSSRNPAKAPAGATPSTCRA
jgi:hypothetical protein